MKSNIYFIKFGNIVKIGRARCVASRIKQHAREKNMPIQFLFSVKGDETREKLFHRVFANYRTQDGASSHWTSHPEHFYIPDDVLAEFMSTVEGEPGFVTGEPEKSTTKVTVVVDRERLAEYRKAGRKVGLNTFQAFATSAVNHFLKDNGLPDLDGIENLTDDEWEDALSKSSWAKPKPAPAPYKSDDFKLSWSITL
jgi:hypothetical protein